MIAQYMALLTLTGLYWWSIDSQSFEFSCDVLSSYSLPSTNDERYLVLGTNDNNAAGLGNILTSFPAAYYFSIFTERRLLIYDHSLLGHFCRVVHCAVPLVSDMVGMRPDLFTHYNLFHQRILTAKDFREIFNHHQPLHEEEILVTSSGTDSKSEWWMNFANLTRCVSRISGCTIGDITCSERHAFQSLITGPFRKPFISYLQSSISGAQDPNMLSSMINFVPHSYSPRFDISIHIRSQLNSFEKGDGNATSHLEEAIEWMKNDDTQEFISLLVHHLKEFLSQTKQAKYPVCGNQRNCENHNYTIYLSADSSSVKSLLLETLKGNSELLGFPGRIQYITLRPGLSLTHVKHIHHQFEHSGESQNIPIVNRDIKSDLMQQDRFDTLLANSSLPLTVFDWYALSLSNTLVSYRSGAKGVSTFVASASRFSGTRDRTKFDRSSRSVGTHAFHVQRNRRGRLFLTRVWYYPNFELEE